MRLHHVQLAMPPAGEELARKFYRDLLGMEEVRKPPALAARGGVWFRLGDAELHLGVEDGFRPARRAHPALEIEDLESVAQTLEAHGYPVEWDDLLPGFRRFYVSDPFENRVELLQRV